LKLVPFVQRNSEDGCGSGGFLKGSWQRRSDDQAAKKEARPLCEPGGEFGEEKGEIDGTA
jgi:hypothetical protein